MAHVAPFRGIRYNPSRIADLAEVTTPPYDVISEAEQEAFHERHPRNVIRLILNRSAEGDTPEENPHTRAARCFRDWLDTGVLVRDPAPALYLTRVDFPMGGTVVRRYGLIASVRLEPFHRGIILPHERTFSKVKSERLDLMKQCHANFSPIFSTFPDAEGLMDRLRRSVHGVAPSAEFTDADGHRHLLWPLTDPDLHQVTRRAMADRKIYIADGHHRYETALAYRDWVADRTPNFTADHPANHVMMYLCAMQDPGLVILPAHRMLESVPDQRRRALLDGAAPFFDITAVSLNGNGAPAAARTCTRMLDQARDRDHAIGVFIKDRPEFWVISLKPGVMEERYARRLPPPLRSLDVTVLTQLVLSDLLSVEQERLDDNRWITYTSRAEAAVERVLSGGCDMAFLLNPTRMEQVREIAENGLIMPRKSTYFYPKVVTGQVLKALGPPPSLSHSPRARRA